METPILNSISVFVMGSTALITYVLLIVAFLAVVLAIVRGRNAATGALLQIAGTLFFLLGFMLGLKLTVLTVTFLTIVIAFGDGFVRYGRGYRAIAVLLVFAHIVACYMALTGKIARFQLMKNVSELEVLSAVIYFIAFKTWANGNHVVAAGLTTTASVVSVGYIYLALHDAMLTSYFVALGICALFPRNGILGFFKASKAEAEASVEAVKVLNKRAAKATKPTNVGNRAKNGSTARKNLSSYEAERQRKLDDVIQQQILMDQLNDELWEASQQSLYYDDIDYLQE